MSVSTLFDRIVSYVSPEAGLNRLRARVAADMFARQYEAARPNRNTSDWRRPSTSAQIEVGQALSILRNSAREMVRNNPHLKKAVGDLADLTIGTGLVPRPKTGDPALDKRLLSLWSRSVRTMDIEGVHSAYGLQRVVAKALWESGEVFGRRMFRRIDDGLAVPLQYQVFEGDFCDHSLTKPLAAGRIVQGVQFDARGARRAYHMFGDHPGNGWAQSFGAGRNTAVVPASEIRHVFEALRPGQVRGVPPFHASMLTARNLESTDDAKDLRTRLEACLTLVVSGADVGPSGTSNETLGPIVRDANGDPVEQIEPGLVAYMRGGQNVHVVQPSTIGGYTDYRVSRLQSIAAGARVTYEVISSDLSRVNYSSYRAGMNLMWRMIEAIQHLVIIPMYCEPQWADFVEACILTRQVPYDTPIDVTFTAPSAPSIDPVKDAMADLIETRAGFKSLFEAIAARGYDPHVVIEEIKEVAGLLDRMELVLDSDARKVSRTGIMQDASKLAAPADRALPANADADAVIRQIIGDPDLRERVLAMLPHSADT